MHLYPYYPFPLTLAVKLEANTERQSETPDASSASIIFNLQDEISCRIMFNVCHSIKSAILDLLQRFVLYKNINLHLHAFCFV